MRINRAGSGRILRRNHDGTPTTGDPLLDPRPVSKSLSMTFHPMAASTLVTIVTTERGGVRRWDRATGTMVIPVSVDSLRGLDQAQVIRTLLRATLDD